MPDFSPDAQLTFEYGPNLVMLNGTLQRGLSAKELLFSVSDGVQVPPRRRDTRLRARLSVTVPAAVRRGARDLHGGRERDRAWASRGPISRRQGRSSACGSTLPDGTAVAATTSVVRVTGSVTAAEDRALRGGQPRPPGPLRPRPPPGVAGGRGARAARRGGRRRLMVIPQRCNGGLHSGNGGYSAGVFAQAADRARRGQPPQPGPTRHAARRRAHRRGRSGPARRDGHRRGRRGRRARPRRAARLPGGGA